MPYTRLKAPYTWASGIFWTVRTSIEARSGRDAQPTPSMFLETVANSAVTGDITPDEKNAKKMTTWMRFVIQKYHDLLSMDNATMKSGSDDSMIITHHQGIDNNSDNTVAHSGPWLSVSHPVKGAALTISWVHFRNTLSGLTHKRSLALQPPRTRGRLSMNRNSISTVNAVEEPVLDNCIPLWISRWENVTGQRSTVDFTRIPRLWKVQQEPDKI